jgi:hypothetical protein
MIAPARNQYAHARNQYAHARNQYAHALQKTILKRALLFIYDYKYNT